MNSSYKGKRSTLAGNAVTAIRSPGALGEPMLKHRSARNTQLARSIALALGVATVPMAYAQDATAPAAATAAAPETLEEVIVSGIRASLTSSESLKRNAQGVVDGISAEDIGKFPDTNLAESMQRITGVSIDRANGEGSKVTVRGIGPDFNLVLLNGRQMPGANINDTSASDSRSFDFANLASESIAALEVYKTTSADRPTGGIGATVNIKTARPLDRPGRQASFGVKGVTDRSNQNLPVDFKGSSFTPELSGIYSETFANDTIGVAISASYQDRAAGYNQASVQSGWLSVIDAPPPVGNGGNDWGSILGSPNSQVTNRPALTDIYQVPIDLRYLLTGIERKRTNGQLTLQYKPVDSLTATLDYTYSENKIHTQRQEISAWFGAPPASTVSSSWTNGPVAGPLTYTQNLPCADTPTTVNGVSAFAGCQDLAMARSNYSTKAKNNSIGFNLKWEATDALNFEFDAHDSTATSGEDGPLGSNNTLGISAFFRGTSTINFSNAFPVLSIALPASLNGVIDPAYAEVTGSSFRNSYTKAEVQQAQLKGDWKFAQSSKLDFGLSLTDVKNRSAFSNMEQDNWGGLGNPTLYPDSLFTPDTIAHYFRNFPGASSPALFNQYFNWNFNAVRAAAIQAWDSLHPNGPSGASMFSANPAYSTDRDTTEKSNSAYVQYRTDVNIGRPAHVGAGLRYEKTDVTSKALVPIAIGDVWGSANEFTIQFGPPGFTTLTGSYSYVLPNIDFDVDLTPDLKARVSWGKSIGRPSWGAIQGGQVLDPGARIVGGTGSQGNPALKPLESKNLDLSLEWYYAKGSYLSAGYFKKDVSNFVGISTINATPFNVPNPGAGPWVAEAVAQGCTAGDVTCIRNYILNTYGGVDPAAVKTGTDPNGNATGTIAGRPGIDPATNFQITVPVNSPNSNSIDGWELALQHMFGDSGFGAVINYTKVKSDLKYNLASYAQQFPLVGLSDTANFVGFYENAKWEVRLAYNWRDAFYTGTDQRGSPVFTAPYGQVDANVSYKITDNFSVQAEAINLTDRNQRTYSRTIQAVEFATQTGARYMIGARYTLGK